MTAKEAIEKLGGQTRFARMYGIKIGTAGAWVSRGFPAKVLLENKLLVRDLKKIGYEVR